MEPKLVSELTYDELKHLMKQAFKEAIQETSRDQSTAQADKVVQDLRRAQVLKG